MELLGLFALTLFLLLLAVLIAGAIIGGGECYRAAYHGEEYSCPVAREVAA